MQTDVIFEVQEALRNLHFSDQRYPPIIPSGVYTAQTEQAVRLFQRLENLEESGRIDAQTFSRLKAINESLQSTAAPLDVFDDNTLNLKEGSDDPRIYILQSVLNMIAPSYGNLPAITLSGLYDTQTADAVRTIQKIARLEESGALDTETWNYIARLYQSRTKHGSGNR